MLMALLSPIALNNLTIDGTDPVSGTRMWLEGYPSDAGSHTIHPTKIGQSITIQNANVKCYSSYGILYDAGYTYVTLSMSNVYFTGVTAIVAIATASKVVFTPMFG